MISSKKLTITYKLAVSGMAMALYVAIMYLTQNFAFGQYQIRIATSLYALSAIHPFLIVPLGLSNMLSNIVLGSLGPLDAFGGLAAGLLTAGSVYLIVKFIKYKWRDILIALPIVLIPGLLVPVWLSVLLEVPYAILAASLCIGQIIPGITGVLLVKGLKNVIK